MDKRLSTAYRVALVILTMGSLQSVAQQAFYPLRFSVLKHPAPGYFLMAPNSWDSLGFVDHGGRSIHAIAAERSSSLFWQQDNTVTFIDARRAHFKMGPDLSFVDTLRLTGYETDFHECRTLANGNTILLGFQPRTIDMSKVISGGKPNATVIGGIIREVTPGGNTVMEWSTFDHIDITSATDDIDLTLPAIDYAHINSISEDGDGNLLLSIRHVDAVVKIDRKTGKVIWWLGGQKSKRNDFSWTNDVVDGFRGFSHQHCAVVMSNGNLLLFDNGNLREPRYSRAVIYKLDQTARTVRRVWEYRHTPDIYAPTMGSVQELNNGNILIGWGSSGTSVVCTEVTTDGVVEAELTTDEPSKINSYRVMKAVFSMTGVQKDITSSGTHSFVQGDSSAHLGITVANLSAPTNVVVERHWNTVYSPDLEGATACRILPARWSVRARSNNAFSASMMFSVGSIPGIDQPASVVVFHRSTEGEGRFRRIVATYDSVAKTLTTPEFKTGEYIAIYETCRIPYPEQPLHRARRVPAFETSFQWTRVAENQGYQLQLSTSPVFTAVVLDTTIRGAEGYTQRTLDSYTTYHWRVRARLTQTTYGPWSQPWSFTTGLIPPRPLSPMVVVDTIATGLQPVLSWSPSGGATSYHVRLFVGDTTVPFAEDTTNGTTWVTPVLRSTRWYTWDVRALADTSTSPFSVRATFLTTIDRPSPIWPLTSFQKVPFDTLSVVWNSVPQAQRYRVQVWSDADGMVVDSLVNSIHVFIAGLQPASTYGWAVRAEGSYGPSAWSDTSTFRTTSTDGLAPAVLLTPIHEDTVSRDNVVLAWLQPGATTFSVEIGTSPSMDTIVHSVNKVSSMLYNVPSDVIEYGVSYYWRVLGTSPVGDPGPSATIKFMTAAAPPPPIIGLIPIEPAKGATNVDRSGVFRWSFDSRVDDYQVQLFRESSAIPVRTYTTADTAAAYAGLDAQTVYRWNVTGRKVGSFALTGPDATFTTGDGGVSVVFEDHDAFTDVLRGTTGCDGDIVEITVSDLQGRLVERVTIPVIDRQFTYAPPSGGVLIVTALVCGHSTTAMVLAR
jgi:hypothetical protein